MSALIPANEDTVTSATSNPTSQAQTEAPQGLKPGLEAANFGAAEAAPLQQRTAEVPPKAGTPDGAGAKVNLLPVKGALDSPAQPQGGLAQDDRKDKKQKKNKKDKEHEEEKPPEKDGKPDLVLSTSSGGKLILPSRDKPVEVEQLSEWGLRQEDKIAADSCMWRGKTARRASIEHCLSIRGKNKHVCRMHLNDVQCEVDYRAGKRNIILKARQMGITTYVAARFFLNTMLQPGTLSVQVAHDQQSAEEIFRIVHRFLENLPEAWRRSALKISRANVRQIIFPKLDSEYRVESAADRCAGRGLTIQNLHCSEVARWPHDVAETLAALRAAVPPDGEIFLESTPSGAGGTFYEEWQSAPETGYVRHFFPWWRDKGYKREPEVVNFTDEELGLMTQHELDAGQIAFRREMRLQFRNRFLEEYAEDAATCFLTSGNCMFDCEKLADALKKPEVLVDSKQNGKLLYFLQPQPGRDYIVGVDPSSGHPEGDYGCIEVIDATSGAQCAEWHDRFRPEEAAANAVRLAKDYNMAMIAVERNGVGEAVVTELRVHTDYPNVYCSHNAAGWLTTDMSRERALTNFRDLLDNQTDLFNSHRLLQECRTFVRNAKGKCAAAAGAHDDMVMAMAIAQAVRGERRIRIPGPEKEPGVAALAA